MVEGHNWDKVNNIILTSYTWAIHPHWMNGREPTSDPPNQPFQGGRKQAGELRGRGVVGKPYRSMGDPAFSNDVIQDR
jgi:hypothetical protein